VEGERRAVVDTAERVLDVALRAEDQCLGRGTGRQPGEVLGRQRVQPGQAVGALEPDDVAVREVDEAVAVLERALLLVEGAVVGGDRGVDAVTGYRSGRTRSGVRRRR
jgi:hypothetical protein